MLNWPALAARASQRTGRGSEGHGVRGYAGWETVHCAYVLFRVHYSKGRVNYVGRRRRE